MTSRTGLFPAQPAVTKSKIPTNKCHKPATVRDIKIKNERLPLTGIIKCKNSPEVGTAPHARCAACSVKKDKQNVALKSKYASCRKSFPVMSSNVKISPKSILKKNELKSEVKRHVQFNRSADQASLRAKLNEWLKERGKTPSKYKDLMRFGANVSAKKRTSGHLEATSKRDYNTQRGKHSQKEVARKSLFGQPPVSDYVKSDDNKENDGLDNTYELIDAVGPEVPQGSNSDEGNHCLLPAPDKDLLENINILLDQCLNLFNSGCPLEDVLSWLSEMEAQLPQVATYAPFYVCKAKVLAAFPQMVIDVYTTAIRNNAQPCDLLAKEMKAATTKYIGPYVQPGQKTPQDVSPEFSHDGTNKGSQSSRHSSNMTAPKTPKEGSTVKYKCITPSRRSTSETVFAIVTPVRRSFRLSNKYATPCQGEIGDVVENVSEIRPTVRRSMVFQGNPALAGGEEVSHKLQFNAAIQN